MRWACRIKFTEGVFSWLVYGQGYSPEIGILLIAMLSLMRLYEI